MNKSCVAILDPRGIITEGGQDVILRHATYAQYLSKHVSSDKLYLVILSTGIDRKSVCSINSFSIERISKPTFNSIIFAKKAASVVKSKNLDVKFNKKENKNKIKSRLNSNINKKINKFNKNKNENGVSANKKKKNTSRKKYDYIDLY